MALLMKPPRLFEDEEDFLTATSDVEGPRGLEKD